MFVIGLKKKQNTQIVNTLYSIQIK